MHLHKIENQYNILWEYNFELENIKKTWTSIWSRSATISPFFSFKMRTSSKFWASRRSQKIFKNIKKNFAGINIVLFRAIRQTADTEIQKDEITQPISKENENIDRVK